MLPEWAPLRQLGKARAASMRVAIEKDDIDELVTVFDQQLVMGRAVAYQPTLISYLVGMLIDFMALEELQHELLEHRFATESCRALLASMDRHLPLPPMALPIGST